MKIKKLLAMLLAFVLAFSCMSVIPFTASADVTTEKMIVISPNNSGDTKYANAFIPLNFLEVDGKRLHSQESDEYYYFKLSFKAKLINGCMPIVGVVRYAYWYPGAQSEYNYVNNNQKSHSDTLLYSTYDEANMTYTALIKLWINPDPDSGVHSALTIGNMEHNNNWHHEYTFDSHFAFTAPELYAYDTTTNSTFGNNLIAPITEANFTGNTYKHPQNGYNGSDGLLKAPANKWSIDTTSSLVSLEDIPEGYFDTPTILHNYEKVDEVPATETETGVSAHYVCNCGECDGKYYLDSKGANEVTYDQLVIPVIVTGPQKMIVISPNKTGEIKYANAFIPLNFLEVDGKRLHSQESDEYYYFKLSFKAKLNDGAWPIVGVVRYAYWYPGATSEFWYANNNQETHSDTLLYSTYDYTTSTYTAIIKFWINPDPSTGVHTALTIGNMEHSGNWHRESSFNAGFAFTEPELYAYDTNTKSTYGKNLVVPITDATFTGQTYKHPDNGYNRADGLLKAPANKWSIDTTASLVSLEEIPDGYFDPSPHKYVKINEVLATSTENGVAAHYICECGECDGKYYLDSQGLNPIAYEDLLTPPLGEPKMIVISPNDSGEQKFANVFIPVTFRKAGDTEFGGSDYYFKLTFKAKVIGDSLPIIGMVRYAYWNGGGQAEYNDANNNQEEHSDTVLMSSYNPQTMTFTAIVKTYIADRNCHPETGVHSFITIGNMEHSGDWYRENNFYTNFAFTDPQLYAYDPTKEDTYGENLITGIYDSTVYTDDIYKFGDNGYVGSDCFINAPANKWCIDGEESLISVQNIPNGYFDPSDVDASNNKMLRLGGAGNSQNALSTEANLTAGKTYQFDIDYRAFGGVEPYIYIETANSSGYSTLSSYTLTSADANGAHRSIKFTMPSNAKSGNNFKLTLGQKAPVKRNGTVYFANAELYELENNNITGENIFANGDFRFGYTGKVTTGNKGTLLYGWDVIDALSYTEVTLMSMPKSFFDADKDYSSNLVYEFQGGDMYKPQFDFMFAPNKTYLLSYDYNCENDSTVNVYIQSHDNSLKAEKISRISDNKYRATYKITTANTSLYESHTAANGNIRFALNGNSYDSAFYISNIEIYEVNDDEIIGANLVGDLNPIYSDNYYSMLENEGDSVSFALAKNDSKAAAQTVNIGHGWNGNLNYQSANNNTYSNMIKVNDEFFTYYSDAEKLTSLRKLLLGTSNGYNPYEDSLNPAYDPNNDTKTDIKDLVRIKKSIAADDYSVADAETNGGIYEVFDTIKCYGDSITQGMGYESSPEKTYPGQLNTMLNNKYTILNGGGPSEPTFTIMSRQGALTVFTDKEFKFTAGQDTITIGDKNDNGFVTSTGVKLDLIYYLGNQLSINDVIIDGVKYTVIVEDFTWTPSRACTFKLKRADASEVVTIPEGTKVQFNNTVTPDSCGIYFMGANGSYTSTDDLIAQYKAMIDYHGSNNYMVVIPYTNTNYDQKFREAFGEHCVSFREAAITYGLEFEGITPTSADNEKIAEGLVPPSLCLNNTYDVHLNDKGYHLLATLLYQQGTKIGVFDTNN